MNAYQACDISPFYCTDIPDLSNLVRSDLVAYVATYRACMEQYTSSTRGAPVLVIQRIQLPDTQTRIARSDKIQNTTISFNNAAAYSEPT